MSVLDVRFAVPDLRALDAVRCEAMALAFFEDERPLRGALGLCDWRMMGRLSRMLVRGDLRGARGERALTPGRPRLGAEKLFLFGLGPRADFDEDTFRAVAGEMLATLDAARVGTTAIALPGRALELIEPERAMMLFLELPEARAARDELVVIDHAEAQRQMAPSIERARRRARAAEGA